MTEKKVYVVEKSAQLLYFLQMISVVTNYIKVNFPKSVADQ